MVAFDVDATGTEQASRAPALLFPEGSLGSTTGTYLIGTFISLILYGICILQFYQYARVYRQDKLSIRALVLVIMFLETIHAIFPMHTAYHYLVKNYDRLDVLIHGVWSLNIQPIIAALTTLVSQAFFARRVSLIGMKHRLVAAMAMTCLIAALGLSIAMTNGAFKLSYLPAFLAKERRITSAALSCGAVADFLLSASIIGTLHRIPASPTGISKSRSDVAVLYILDSGLLTGLVNGCSAVAAIAAPAQLLWGGINLVAVRLYLITLLSVLNSRDFLIGRGIRIFAEGPFPQNIIARADHLAVAEQWNVPRVPEGRGPAISISIMAETEVYRQEDHKDSISAPF